MDSSNIEDAAFLSKTRDSVEQVPTLHKCSGAFLFFNICFAAAELF